MNFLPARRLIYHRPVTTPLLHLNWKNWPGSFKDHSKERQTQFGMQRFNYLPPVIKNLLIINGLVFLATWAIPGLTEKLALYYPASPYFRAYQIVTHMFTHGSLSHIFSTCSLCGCWVLC